MEVKDIVAKILKQFNIFATDFIRKPRADHPGWTNEYFLNLIVSYDTGPEIIRYEGCGEQTFNRAARKLLRPILGTLNGGNETYKNKLLHLVCIKKCPTCSHYLEYSSFGIDNSSPYGVTTYCTTCMSTRNKRFYDNNKDTYHKPYIDAHRSEYNARNAYRRAKRVAATPSWANDTILKRIYEYCPEGCHVDHKVPLQGDNVCGLHVENNLQYLTVEENLHKSNKLLEEFSNSNWT